MPTSGDGSGAKHVKKAGAKCNSDAVFHDSRLWPGHRRRGTSCKRFRVQGNLPRRNCRKQTCSFLDGTPLRPFFAVLNRQLKVTAAYLPKM